MRRAGILRRALLCLALLTGASRLSAEDDAIRQRLIPRPARVSNFNQPPPADCPFERSRELAGVRFTGRYRTYTGADTWYPSWAADGNLYSPWTDGRVGSMSSSSGQKRWTTGHARITGDDPLHLKVTPLGLHKAPAAPYGGRYPCGSLVHDGVWYYGTYCLDWRRYPWDIMGPFVGFRVSRDLGRTWTDTPCTPSEPLFGESGKGGRKIKMGAPHFVDFGKNMEHSPDGKAYLTGHGATRPGAVCSWISGDRVYLARVTPAVETINDATRYEFFAGRGARGEPTWTGDFARIRPLVEWNDRAGCVAMTYDAPLKKYLMCVTDGGATGRGAYDTWIVESDSVTGPWRLVAFMEEFGRQAYFVNIPSKFIGRDGRTVWLCFSDDWVRRHPSDPPGTRYAMCLYEMKLLGPGDRIPRRPRDFLKDESNVARRSTATASSSYPRYSPAGAVDGTVGGYPGDIRHEWASHNESKGAWLTLAWKTPQRIDRVVLFDRPNRYDYVTAGELTFSEGAKIAVGELPDDASAGREVTFPARTVTWVRFEVTGVKTGYPHIGLSEMAVFLAE